MATTSTQELLQQLRQGRVGGDLGLAMQVVRGLTGELRKDRTRSARTTNALLLVQEAAELVSVLGLFDSLGDEFEGNLDDLHKRVAAARRLLAGFVSAGCRDLRLPEGDQAVIAHHILERGHVKFMSAKTDGERADVVAAACGAVFGVFGREPSGELVAEALGTPFRRGRPRARGRLPVMVEILRDLGLETTATGVHKMLARARSRSGG